MPCDARQAQPAWRLYPGLQACFLKRPQFSLFSLRRRIIHLPGGGCRNREALGVRNRIRLGAGKERIGAAGQFKADGLQK